MPSGNSMKMYPISGAQLGQPAWHPALKFAGLRFVHVQDDDDALCISC